MQHASLGLVRGACTGEGEVADEGCQGGRSVGLLGVPDGHTQSKDERQVVEDCAACTG